MADYLVTLNEPGSYNVGVDYEIPSKSIQYGNIIIGKTPVQDGSETTFSLNDQGAPYTPNNNQQLIVTKNGLFLDPSNDYNISGSQVVFTTPPATNDDIVIIALAAAADLTRSGSRFEKRFPRVISGRSNAVSQAFSRASRASRA